METRTDEIADGIYRFSTFLPGAGIVFNQFLVDAEEPLLFHTGLRALFPGVSGAVRAVMPVERLRWISFGHFEADESGAMNEWMAIAPHAQVAHTTTGVLVSVLDQAVREPRGLADGEVIDLGGKRVRHLATLHVPHAWDAGLMYEETTGTLFAGDLFTVMGDGPATTTDDLVGAAITAEEVFRSTSLTPFTALTIERLATLEPRTLALMHAPAYLGDASRALRDLAGAYRGMVAAALEEVAAAPA